jgi:hypothetical protein
VCMRVCVCLFVCCRLTVLMHLHHTHTLSLYSANIRTFVTLIMNPHALYLHPLYLHPVYIPCYTLQSHSHFTYQHNTHTRARTHTHTHTPRSYEHPSTRARVEYPIPDAIIYTYVRCHNMYVCQHLSASVSVRQHTSVMP